MAQERVQRRLAAILAADVVGYSRMMEQDERGTLSRLKACRRDVIDPSVKAHGGRVVKSTGDGVLVEFPSAVEAVTCAVLVQKAMLARNADLPVNQRLVFRIGINVGDLIIEENDIYGDGVNLAARLEGLSPPGGIAISRAVRDQIRDKLVLPLSDQGEHQVKNIARPVRVFALTPELLAEVSLEGEGSTASPRFGVKPVLLAGGVAAALLMSAGAWWLWSGQQPQSQPVRPTLAAAPTQPKQTQNLSIVVLPFANLSNDPEQDYFADGITEDLTTDLSRIAGSFVIARNTAFTYKGKPVDVKQVGRDLNVRYVLEGSVRRTDDQVRVNAQLIDADTGSHVWAERFDAELKNMIALQDQVTSRIARTLDLQLFESEARRAQRERPTNPTATDLAMQGWAIVNRPSSRDIILKAHALFEEALRIDPDLPSANLGLRRTTYYHFSGRLVDDPSKMLDRAETLVRRVIAQDPMNGRAYNVLGDVLTGKKDMEGAIASMRKAVELNPSDAGGWVSVGYLLAFQGRFDEALEPLHRSMSVSPRDPQVWVAQMWLGNVAFALGRDGEALEWSRKAVQNNPNSYLSRRYYAGIAGSLGSDEEAKQAAADLVKNRPDVTLAKLAQQSPSDHPRFRERVWDRLVQGWVRGGIPE
jgi:TolB-like protein/class 3 adenylate cyclase